MAKTLKDTTEDTKVSTAKKTAKASTVEKSKKTTKSTNAAKEKTPVKKTKEVGLDNKSKKSIIEVKPIKKVVENQKVLFVASECAPFSRTGGLSDVVGALPKSMAKKGIDVRVITPLYSFISLEYRNAMRFIGSINVSLSWRLQYCGIFELVKDGVKYYFIDNEYYFKRDGLYGHFDDGERFAFFSKATLDVLQVINFYPDVIHSNDWHTALVPVFLDVFYRNSEKYRCIKTVFTIHNIEFQGKYDKYILGDVLGIPADKADILMYGDCVNFMKGAIECANIVTTVSETYATEILDPFFSYGLDSILHQRSFKIKGVINGIDIDLYDPMTDIALFKNYSLESIKDKEENKEGLCNLISLPYSKDVPIISMVTRLTTQKGLDLLTAVIEEILCANVQLVILGTGDWKYETMLRDLENRYNRKLKTIVKFSPDLASKIYAGSDMFLMPSRFEPCGLSQMISMRYGTVPIVRETGGLKDTVKPFNPVTKEGTGYTFFSYNAHDMLNTIWRAVGCYYDDKENWKKIIENCMKEDFSWNKSADKYIEIYKNM